MMNARWGRFGGLASVVIAFSWLMAGCVASVDTDVDELVDEQDEALTNSGAGGAFYMGADERAPEGAFADPSKKAVNDEGLPMDSTISVCDICDWPPALK